MSRPSIAYLFNAKNVRTENGPKTAVLTNPRKVFIELKDIWSIEYWEAKKAGTDLSFSCYIRFFDYKNEPYIMHGDKYYKIHRTKSSDEDWMELICENAPADLKYDEVMNA